MAKYVVINNNVVENIVVANSSSFGDLINCDYFIEIDSLDPKPDIGWTYDGQDFSPPEE